MRTATKLVLAGAGVLAATAAVAASERGHVLNVAMPDGSVAHIHYVGDVAPRVMVLPAAEPMPVAFAADDPFAMLDRISYAMDRQMDAMMREASMIAASASGPDGKLSAAALERLPAGTVSYSYTAYSGGSGGQCRQSVQVTSLGQDHEPKVVRQSSGDCSAMNSRAATPAVQPVQPAAPALTPVSLEKAKTPVPKGPVI